MMYYRNRNYSPSLGRFTSPDPIGYEGGLNLYNYCGSDPVNRWDPMGLDWMWAPVTVKNTYGWPGLIPWKITTWETTEQKHDWVFVPGSDPSTPKPLISADEVEARTGKSLPKVNGHRVFNMDYVDTAYKRTPSGTSAITISPNYDCNYDRSAYVRDNAVYDAAVNGLLKYYEVEKLSGDALTAKLTEIDKIAVIASNVRGRSSVDTTSLLSEGFWARGGHTTDSYARMRFGAVLLQSSIVATEEVGYFMLAEGAAQFARVGGGLWRLRKLSQFQTRAAQQFGRITTATTERMALNGGFQVEFGANQLSRTAMQYRLANNISVGRYVAVFEYRASDGSIQTMARASIRGQGHAERLIAKELSSMGG